MNRNFRNLAVVLALSGAMWGATLTAPAKAVASAQHDALKIGPKVGMKIPHDLKTVDQNGQHQDFKTLARKRGLLILFTRSVDW